MSAEVWVECEGQETLDLPDLAPVPDLCGLCMGDGVCPGCCGTGHDKPAVDVVWGPSPDDVLRGAIWVAINRLAQPTVDLDAVQRDLESAVSGF